MRWMLGTIGLALLSLCQVLAQDGPPQKETVKDPGQEKLDRQVEDLNREHEKFLEQSAKTMRALEASLINLGSLEPWPAVDPVFDDSAAWRQALLAAPELSGAELLSRFDELSVSYRWLDAVVEVLPLENYLDTIIQAVHAAGKRTHPASVARLKVELHLLPVHMNMSAAGLVDEVYHIIYCDSQLVVPARVLRGEDLHYAQVAVEFSAYMQVGPGVAQRPALEQAVSGSIAGLFQKLANKPQEAATGAGPWANWLADTQVQEQRLRVFRESYCDERELAAGLTKLAGLGSITTRFVGTENHVETQAFQASDLRAGWEDRFRLWEVPVGLAEGPQLVQHVLVGSVPGANDRRVGGLFSRVALRERDCLVVLGGTFARVSGETYSANKAGIAVEKAMQQGLDAALEDTHSRLLEAIGRFGKAPLPPHPDAAAVAAYLRPKARLAVPEKALMDLSNRIAHRFASEPGIPSDMRANWFHGQGAERVFVLSAAGNARSGTSVYRSAREAIDRVIDGLTLEDPLALWAFEQPWSTNYDYPVSLPEEYGKYFTRTRPSGKGALRQVQVMVARELANRLMNRMDRDAIPALRSKLSELEPRLAQHKILVCEYIPEDGSLSYTLPHYFWYRAAPGGWNEIAAGLSEDFPLKRVGFQRATAPDYLKDVNAPIR